jgi:hypothetical protein
MSLSRSCGGWEYPNHLQTMGISERPDLRRCFETVRAEQLRRRRWYGSGLGRQGIARHASPCPAALHLDCPCPPQKCEAKKLHCEAMPLHNTAHHFMSTTTLGSWLFGIQAVMFVALCYVLPFRYVLRTGRFWRGVLFCWLATTVFTLCSAILGVVLYQNLDKALIDYCFEGPEVLAFAAFGWFGGMIVSAVAQNNYRRRRQPAPNV